MIRKLFPVAALATAVALPVSAAAAEDISYTYVQLDYIVEDIDAFEDDEVFNQVLEDVDDGRGIGIEGSFAFAENFFVFGKYSNTEADFTYIADNGMFVPQGEDIKSFDIGLGYFRPMSDTMDFVARAAYADVDYGDLNFGQVDDDVANDNETVSDAFDDLNEDSSDGYYIDAGVRAQTVEWLELGGGLRYSDMDSGDDISVFGDATFEINQNLGIVLSGDFGDSATVYALGVQYSL